MSEPTTYPGLVKWDDSPLTEKVAWAMGVEAAGKYADANEGRVDCKPAERDWRKWLAKRERRGCHVPWEDLLTINPQTARVYLAFRNGWQAQRAGLLAEHVADILHDAMAYYRINDGKIEDVIERFTENLNLKQWFVGAGE